MLTLGSSSATEHLRKMAVYFDADLIESYGAAIMRLDNRQGKGFISSYEVLPGLAVRVYNITFKKDFQILLNLTDKKQIYFSYTLNGHHFHRFQGIDKQFERIMSNQNLIVVNDPDVKATTVFPGGLRIKLSLIILDKSKLDKGEKGYIRELERNLAEIFDKITENGAQRYVSDIDPDTAQYAEIVARNQRTDVIGRLMTEGAIINMLFNQLQEFNQAKNVDFLKNRGLDNKTLLKCTKVAEYVQDNLSTKITIKDLSNEFSLSPRKLQRGIKHLFGISVNKYIVNVRLAHAKDMIQTSERPVGEIGRLCGFTSRSYFSKIFHERYEFYPADYQKKFMNESALFEISYRSLAAKEITSKDVEKIVNTSINFNSKNGITGCLIYHDRTFFQIIEGSKSKVLSLYEKISSDTRHTEIQLMWKGAKYIRNFSMWSMALITESGSLRVTYEDKEDNIHLGSIVKDLKSSGEVSDAIWRKIRNIIKSSSPINTNKVA